MTDTGPYVVGVGAAATPKAAASRASTLIVDKADRFGGPTPT